MTVQSKLIEIVRMLEQELQDLRLENAALIKRAEDAEYRLKQVKAIDTVTVPPSEGWPSYTYDATMAPLSPLDVYTYQNQPKYEPVTIGNSCAACGVRVEGVIGSVCTRPKCPLGLNYGTST